MVKRFLVLTFVCFYVVSSHASEILEKFSGIHDIHTLTQKVKDLSNDELWQACQESADLYDASPKDAPLQIPIFLRELKVRKWLTRTKLLDVFEDQSATKSWREIAGDFASKDSFMPFENEAEVEQVYQVFLKALSGASDTPEVFRSRLFISCAHFLGQTYYRVFMLQERNEEIPTKDIDKLVKDTSDENIFKRQNKRVESFIDLVLSASESLLDDNKKVSILTLFIGARGINVPRRQEIGAFLRSMQKKPNTPVTREEELRQQRIQMFLEQIFPEDSPTQVDPNSVVLEMTKYAFGASSVDGSWIVSYYDGVSNKIVKMVPVKGVIQSINLGVLSTRGGELLVAHQSSEPNSLPKPWAYIHELQKQQTYIPQQADYVVWPQVFERVFISCKDKVLPKEITQVGLFLNKQSIFPLFTYDISHDKGQEDFKLNHFPIDVMPRQKVYEVWGLSALKHKELYLGEVQIKTSAGLEYKITLSDETNIE